MKLQTSIALEPFANPIDYGSDILLLGSCFVENIGSKLRYYQFNTEVNPFGILYHPVAIERLLDLTRLGYTYTQDDIFKLNDRWHSFDTHSELSNRSREKLLINLNSALDKTRNRLKNASHIGITLGSAWAYRHLASDSLVANCHKIPQKEFSKILSSPADIVASLGNSIEYIRSFNQAASIFLTISPVRHARDGFIRNMRSKAHLITAVHQLLEEDDKLSYFPAYELMMDELRDYRFYGEDMLHPNQLAITYIWERFKNYWINPGSHRLMAEVEEVQKGLSHRPFDTESHTYRDFITRLQDKIAYLQERYPHMDFAKAPSSGTE